MVSTTDQELYKGPTPVRGPSPSRIVGNSLAPPTRPDGDVGRIGIKVGAWTDGAQGVCPLTSLSVYI
jgi:hypothetical protein